MACRQAAQFPQSHSSATCHCWHSGRAVSYRPLVAHDYVNQGALVTSQARRCSGRPAAPGRRYSQKCITLMGEEGEGTRGRNTNFVILGVFINCYSTCMNFLELYKKSEPPEVYSTLFELRWIFKVFSFADIAENMLYYTKQACVLLSNHIF